MMLLFCLLGFQVELEPYIKTFVGAWNDRYPEQKISFEGHFGNLSKETAAALARYFPKHRFQMAQFAGPEGDPCHLSLLTVANAQDKVIAHFWYPEANTKSLRKFLSRQKPRSDLEGEAKFKLIAELMAQSAGMETLRFIKNEKMFFYSFASHPSDKNKDWVSVKRGRNFKLKHLSLAQSKSEY